jgi:hypothetical protein
MAVRQPLLSRFTNLNAAARNFPVWLPIIRLIAMSLHLTNAVANFGQSVESLGSPVLGGRPSAFGRVTDLSGPAHEPPPQTINAQLAVAPNAPTSSADVQPASADILKPKMDYVGNSLSVLKARIDKVAPATTAESVRNRLELLDSQFSRVGNDLKLTHVEADPMQLLRLQNDIYQIDEQLELLTRVVDQTTSGIRSLLQTQI